MAAIPRATARKGSGGGFLVGMFVGLLAGLGVALGIALADRYFEARHRRGGSGV